MNLWTAVLAAVGGAFLGPSLHGWQLIDLLSPLQRFGFSGTENLLHLPASAPRAAAVLERKVLIYAEAIPDGVAFDPTPAGVIAVSAVSPAVSAATGLAVGDLVLSLAGVDVASDHDPLAALDDAEEAMQRHLQQQGAAVVLVVAPSDAPATRSYVSAYPSVHMREKQQQKSGAEPPVGQSTGGWRWSRDPCDPDGKLQHTRQCDASRDLRRLCVVYTYAVLVLDSPTATSEFASVVDDAVVCMRLSRLANPHQHAPKL